MKYWKLLIFILPLLLVGCVSLKPPSTATTHFHYLSPQKRQLQMSRLRAFTVRGAFSIVETKQQPVIANYNWIQSNKSRYRIRVASALNLFSLTILGRPGLVTLWRSGTEKASAHTPERLLQKEMGWSLPLQNLYYWIRGVSAPGPKTWQFDRYGHLTQLVQEGWQIRYSHYHRVQNIDLPQRLVLARSGIRITVVMKRWNF